MDRCLKRWCQGLHTGRVAIFQRRSLKRPVKAKQQGLKGVVVVVFVVGVKALRKKKKSTRSMEFPRFRLLFLNVHYLQFPILPYLIAFSLEIFFARVAFGVVPPHP